MGSLFLPYKTMSREAPFISINYEDEQQLHSTEAALKTIKSKPSGNNLLLSLGYLSNQEKGLIIVVTNKRNTATSAYLTESQLAKYSVPNDPDNPLYFKTTNRLATVDEKGKPSEGVPAIISFNPDLSLMVDKDGFPMEMPNNYFNYISLAHELVHAFHNMNGTSLNRDCIYEDVFKKDSGQRKEEERAVGLPPFHREAFSENTIRAEQGMPLRKSYFFKDDQPAS